MNDLIKYCGMRSKCRECAFYVNIAYCCSLGVAIRELAEKNEGYATLEEAIECAKVIYDECSKKHMKAPDGEHCDDCQYEYIDEFGFYRCKFGRSVCGFDNPSRWGFVKNMKATQDGLF